MKKKSLKRMRLHRETVKRLSGFQAVSGGGTIANCTRLICHTDLCNEGTYVCVNTQENCSNLCESGGACTSFC